VEEEDDETIGEKIKEEEKFRVLFSE